MSKNIFIAIGLIVFVGILVLVAFSSHTLNVKVTGACDLTNWQEGHIYKFGDTNYSIDTIIAPDGSKPWLVKTLQFNLSEVKQ